MTCVKEKLPALNANTCASPQPNENGASGIAQTGLGAAVAAVAGLKQTRGDEALLRREPDRSNGGVDAEAPLTDQGFIRARFELGRKTGEADASASGAGATGT